MYHTIIIAGNLGKDPELRYTPQGTPVCSFSVASTRRWSGGEETIWFRVSAWRSLGENCAKYLAKGRKVLVEGRLKPDPDTGGPRMWTGLKGESRASFDVEAVMVRFRGKGGNGAEGEDEIPF